MNRIYFFSTVALLSIQHLSSQVGIGTETPNPSAVLEIKSDTKGVLIPRVNLIDVHDTTTVPNPDTGLIVYNLEDSGTYPNNVQKNSIYIWKNGVWAKNTEPIYKDGIYTGSGSLSGPTNVTQNANKLAFISTAIDGFSVDGATLSVDAKNHRLGIGTKTPTVPLDVVGNAVLDSPTLSVDALNHRVGIGTTTPSVKLHVAGGIVGAYKSLSANTTLTMNDHFVNFAGYTLTLHTGHIAGQIWYLFAGGQFAGTIAIPAGVSVDYNGSTYTNTTLTVPLKNGRTLIGNGGNDFKLW